MLLDVIALKCTVLTKCISYCFIMAVQSEQSSCCCSRCDSILSASWCHFYGDLAKLAHACQTFLCAVQIVYEGNSVIIRKSIMHFACGVYVDMVFVGFFVYLLVFVFLTA